MFILIDDEYKKLNKKCMSAMYIVYAIEYVILFLILFGIKYIWTADLKNDLSLYDIVTLAILIIALVYIIIAPIVFYRRYQYIITSEKIDIRRGIIIIRRTMVPIERLHQVEIIMGPVNNLFKLADVEVITAGGSAKIQFLELPEANRIAEELNQQINSILKARQNNE